MLVKISNTDGITTIEVKGQGDITLGHGETATIKCSTAKRI